MAKKLSKKEAERKIEDFFKNTKNKTAGDVKKIKKLAMRHNIKLGEKRKTFCKKCLTPYKDFSLRIKDDKVRMECGKCGHIARWKFVF